MFRAALLAGLIIVVATVVLAAHWPALSAGAVCMDDSQYLADNQLVQNPGWASARRFLTEVLEPSTVMGYYQPLAMISLMLDYAAGGRMDNLVPFHRMSLILHVFNSCLLIVLVYVLFGQPWVAAIVGLLFGVHPLTVEPIPWIGERKTLLAAFFALWCLIFYVRYTRSQGWKSYAACFVLYVLALMSKPTSTPLPVCMLLLDFWPLGRLNKRAIVEKLPFFVVGGISAVVTVISQARAGAVTMPGEYSPLRIVLIFCHNIIFYLYKIVWPTNLCSHYPFPDPLDMSDPMVQAGVVGTCILIPLMLISLRWTRSLITGWLFFFVAILPTMGVIGFTNVIASDRFVYLPSVGLILVLAWFLSWVWTGPSVRSGVSWRRIASLVVTVVLAVSLTLATRRQLTYWRDTKSLCKRMMAVAPQAAMPHFGLGLYYKKQDRLDEAVAEYRQAIELKPDYVQTYNNLANVLAEQGRVAEAIEHYNQAIRLEPNDPLTYFNLGLILAQNNEFDQAITNYQKALQLKDDYPEAHYRLAKALVRSGKIDDGIEHYKKALQYDPGNAETHNDLGVAMDRKGKAEEAIVYYARAVQLNPQLTQAHNNLAVALINQGKTEEAVKHWKQALELKPDFATAHKNLGLALASQGKSDEAFIQLRTAVQLQPLNADIYCDIGYLLNKLGRTDEAIAEYRKALEINPSHLRTRTLLDQALASRPVE